MFEPRYLGYYDQMTGYDMALWRGGLVCLNTPARTARKRKIRFCLFQFQRNCIIQPWVARFTEGYPGSTRKTPPTLKELDHKA
jgi:hypothetical protein